MNFFCFFFEDLLINFRSFIGESKKLLKNPERRKKSGGPEKSGKFRTLLFSKNKSKREIGLFFGEVR